MSIHHMFPLMEVPFDAYCFLVDHCRDQLNQFVPTKLEEDLKAGKLNAMVYWYPRLVLKLYQFSEEGLDFRGYLETLNPNNVYLFEEIFKETTKKLDTLRDKKLKKNIHDEVLIRNGSI